MAWFDDFVEEARYLAMRSVLKPDGEYFIRKVCRWYSNTFATPLHVVERDIPIEDAMLHYFEWKYERMEEEERDLELDEMLLTPEEREQRKMDAQLAAEADDDFLEQTKKDLEEAKQKDPDLRKSFKHDGISAPPLAPVIGKNNPIHPAVTGPDAPASIPLKEIPPDIQMSFVDNLEDEIEKWDLMGEEKPDPVK